MSRARRTSTRFAIGPTDTRLSYREEIRNFLHLLGSEEEQLAYERNVPHVDITAELLCMWFDDFYDAEHVACDL